MAKFRTTVVVPSGLVGVVYYIPPASTSLPYFEFLNPVGVIYTSSLNVPQRDSLEGFPGVTNRFEWFAIDYRGRFWIQKPGLYQFALTSEDGSKLYIDDELIVGNDGIHPSEVKTATVGLDRGVHRIRVSYFQGPRCAMALILRVAPPGEGWRVFSTDDFKPPPNTDTWDDPDAVDAAAPAIPGPQLRISPVAGAPGETVKVEVWVKSRQEKGTIALRWEAVVPAQVLELVGAPEIGAAAADSGKALRCSTQKSYVYDCTLEGGEQPISDGSIAIFRFKIRADAQSRTTALRLEKAKAIGPDQQRFTLSGAEGTVTIR